MSTDHQPPVIVWFRNDLRLRDHPALSAAAGAPIVAVHVLDDAAAGNWARGGASRWWLHQSIDALATELATAGVQLVLRRGGSVEVISELARETGAQAVHCSRGFEPWSVELETGLRDKLHSQGVLLRRFAGVLIHDPDQIKTKEGGPYKVYSPFWRTLSGQEIRVPVSRPTLHGYRGHVASDRLADWGLEPTRPDWAEGLRETWTPGEVGAQRRLAEFLDTAIEQYDARRDLPGIEGTSRLSPHLHFGEVSPAQVWQAVGNAIGRRGLTGKAPTVFLKELVWREFSYHLLHHFPSLPEKAFREPFERFPWAPHQGDIGAWQKGRTGYPIVDAGMRELWATGWMHNRVRMITASFLTKHLMVPWQVGEAWFWDCLVDADLASNSASWQWVAGSGADAAPYFRIFNPILQGQKFDPEGEYVRRWVPELAKLPGKYLHAPWTAPAGVLGAAGVRLGETYPVPIVEHGAARERAMAAYEMIRAG
ncbi:MAG: DNA photolyase family protein [Alphaproteobacteria bacterium]|nr:DNA photolyase family protein [Alphaproteobacteria bacterium]